MHHSLSVRTVLQTHTLWIRLGLFRKPRVFILFQNLHCLVVIKLNLTIFANRYIFLFACLRFGESLVYSFLNFSLLSLLPFASLIFYVLRYVVFITVWIWLSFVSIWGSRNTVVMLIVVVSRWHFMFRWALPLTFDVILNVFILNLSLSFYEEGFYEVFHKKRFLV